MPINIPIQNDLLSTVLAIRYAVAIPMEQAAKSLDV
jgi:hypothetical protein